MRIRIETEGVREAVVRPPPHRAPPPPFGAVIAHDHGLTATHGHPPPTPDRERTLPAAGWDRADRPSTTPSFCLAPSERGRSDQERLTFCGCCDGTFVRCAAPGQELEWEVTSTEDAAQHRPHAG